MSKQLLWTAALAIAIAGCKKDKSESSDGSGAPQRDGAALWKQAPEGTRMGFVVAPGTGADLHRGFVEVASSLMKHPAGAMVLGKLLAEAKKAGVDPMQAGGFAAAGIDLSRGAAFFFRDEDDAYAIFPIADRAKFRAKLGGVEKDGIDHLQSDLMCAPSGDLYRCAMTAEKLKAWKPAAKPIDAGWPTALRGSVEFLATGAVFKGDNPFQEAMDQPTLIRAGLRIERGGVLARWQILATPKKFLSIGNTPLADAAKKRNVGALLVTYAKAGLDLARADISPADLADPGFNGVTKAQMLDAFTGELVAYAPAGTPSRGFVEIGLNDPAPLKALAPACGMAPPLAPGVAIKATKNGCAATIGPPIMPTPVEISVAIEDKALVATIGDQSAGRDGKGVKPPGYVADHTWLGAMWMRGSILGSADQIPAAQLKQMLVQAPQASLGLWAFAHISELGLGVRTDDKGFHGFVRVSTTWRNPKEVVAELEPLIQRFATGDLAAAADVQTLAKKHGKSPLATDMSLGSSGGAVGAASIGVMAAVAIPAFMKYIKKSKTTEARMFVKKMYDGARAFYLDAQTGTGMGLDGPSFPGKSTAITPPLGTCCQGPEGKCMPDANLWTDETWVQLQFSVDDPHYYSYQYEVAPDGKSFTVRAFGDLDCDGDYSTFEMQGDASAAGDAPLARIKELE